MTAVIALVVVLTVSALCLRAAYCNLRHWRRVTRLPLVIADPRELRQAVPPEWPFRRSFPPPGRPGAWSLTAEECSAFQQIAEARDRRSTIRDVIMNMLAATAVGAAAATAISHVHTYLKEYRTLSATHDTLGQLQLQFAPEQRPTLIAAALLGLLLGNTVLRHDYADAARAYGEAADQQRVERSRDRSARHTRRRGLHL